MRSDYEEVKKAKRLIEMLLEQKISRTHIELAVLDEFGRGDKFVKSILEKKDKVGEIILDKKTGEIIY